jgi:hypothetical protein
MMRCVETDNLGFTAFSGWSMRAKNGATDQDALYELNVKIIASKNVRLIVQTDYLERIYRRQLPMSEEVGLQIPAMSARKWKAATDWFTILPEGRMPQQHESAYIGIYAKPEDTFDTFFKLTFVSPT